MKPLKSKYESRLFFKGIGNYPLILIIKAIKEVQNLLYNMSYTLPLLLGPHFSINFVLNPLSHSTKTNGNGEGGNKKEYEEIQFKSLSQSKIRTTHEKLNMQMVKVSWAIRYHNRQFYVEETHAEQEE